MSDMFGRRVILQPMASTAAAIPAGASQRMDDGIDWTRFLGRTT